MTLGIITMVFSGGLIPYFLLSKDLGMIDKFIVYIIPSAFSMFDLNNGNNNLPNSMCISIFAKVLC